MSPAKVPSRHCNSTGGKVTESIFHSHVRETTQLSALLKSLQDPDAQQGNADLPGGKARRAAAGIERASSPGNGAPGIRVGTVCVYGFLADVEGSENGTVQFVDVSHNRAASSKSFMFVRHHETCTGVQCHQICEPKSAKASFSCGLPNT